MDTTHPTTAPRRGSRTVAALLAAVLALTAGFVATTPGVAGAADPPRAGLTWRVSGNTWTSSSLSPARSVTTPTTIVGDSGAEQFSWPQATDVSVDAFTGAVFARFPGSFTIGNLAQGNYRINVADLELTIPAGRATGTVTANVSWGIAAPGTEPTLNTPTRVAIANLTFPAGSITDTGANLSFTVTPDFILRTDLTPPETANPNGYKQFPAPLVDLLQTSTPPLGSHFRQTAVGQDGKAPAPLSVSLDYVPNAPPAGLTWRVSQQAWTSSSLSPAHGTDAPATKTAQGFSFPEVVESVYDPETGMGQIDFSGALILGNLNQGNYRLKFADPSLELHGDGTGDLVADVSWGIAAPGTEPTYGTATRLSVADLTLPEGSITVDGDELSFLVTPDFVLRPDLTPEANPGGWRTFPQPLVDLLQTSSPPLGGHFRQTADNQPLKAPAPLGVNVTFSVPDPDEDLVEAIYRAALERGPSDSELTYWAGRVETKGAAAVANDISNSTEGRRKLVRDYYSDVLDRLGSTTDVDYWAGRLGRGLAPGQVLTQFLASPEAWTVWGGDADGLTEAAYWAFLDRAPDSTGGAYWSGRLAAAPNAGARRSVLGSFARTYAATTAAVNGAVGNACGTLPDLTAEDRAALEGVWTATGRNAVRLTAAAVVLVCPGGPLVN